MNLLQKHTHDFIEDLCGGLRSFGNLSIYQFINLSHVINIYILCVFVSASGYVSRIQQLLPTEARHKVSLISFLSLLFHFVGISFFSGLILEELPLIISSSFHVFNERI